jgi:hypothetical protein
MKRRVTRSARVVSRDDARAANPSRHDRADRNVGEAVTLPRRPKRWSGKAWAYWIDGEGWERIGDRQSRPCLTRERLARTDMSSVRVRVTITPVAAPKRRGKGGKGL